MTVWGLVRYVAFVLLVRFCGGAFGYVGLRCLDLCLSIEAFRKNDSLGSCEVCGVCAAMPG